MQFALPLAAVTDFVGTSRFSLIPTALLAHTAIVPPRWLVFAVCWVVYLIPIALIAGPVFFFGRKRADWNGWDYAILALPIVVWFVGAATVGQEKDGIEAESLILGCIAPLAPILRVAISRRVDQKVLAFGVVALLCALAASLVLFLPKAVDQAVWHLF
jgi:hypothetical protein